MTSQWRHRNKTHSWYSHLNSLQNVYFRFFIFGKLIEWRCFVTYLWNDPRIVGKMTKRTMHRQQSESETSATCRHSLHFSPQQMHRLIQLTVLKSSQHYLVTDSSRSVAWCEFRICDVISALQTSPCDTSQCWSLSHFMIVSTLTVQ